jgi:hypothetical protein
VAARERDLERVLADQRHIRELELLVRELAQPVQAAG